MTDNDNRSRYVYVYIVIIIIIIVIVVVRVMTLEGPIFSSVSTIVRSLARASAYVFK